jgi:hypothetical protein
LLGGANAERVWHPSRLKDPLELRDQLDPVSYQVVESGFLTGVVFKPLKTFDML